MCSVGFTGVAVRANQSKLQVLHVFCYAPKSELTFQFCLPVFQDWSVWGGRGLGGVTDQPFPQWLPITENRGWLSGQDGGVLYKSTAHSWGPVTRACLGRGVRGGSDNSGLTHRCWREHSRTQGWRGRHL